MICSTASSRPMVAIMRQSVHQPQASRASVAATAAPSARLSTLRQQQPVLLHTAPRCRRVSTSRFAVSASWNNNSSPGVLDRVVSAVPYLLPLFDALRYGKFLIVKYPIFSTILAPIDPLIQIYFSVPYARVIALLVMYLVCEGYRIFPRWVRCNAVQAFQLDIMLILPRLFESVLSLLKIRPMGGIGLQIYMTVYNTIFIFIFACVAFGIAYCLAAKTVRLPFVAEATDYML